MTKITFLKILKKEELQWADISLSWFYDLLICLKAYSGKIHGSQVAFYLIPNYYITFGMEFSKSVDFCHFNGHIFDEEVLHQSDFYLCEQKKNAFMITDKKDRENLTTRSCQIIFFRHFGDIIHGIFIHNFREKVW